MEAGGKREWCGVVRSGAEWCGVVRSGVAGRVEFSWASAPVKVMPKHYHDSDDEVIYFAVC